MKNAFTISNFRVFNAQGAKVEFNPVTILTGANSSGKSSYVKALVLLKDWLDTIRNEYKKNGTFSPASHNLDCSRSDLRLKGFSSLINHSALPTDGVTFSLDLHFDEIIGDYTVEYKFEPRYELFSPKKDNTDGFDYGVLSSIKIKSAYESSYFFEAENRNGLTVSKCDLSSCLLKHFHLFQVFSVLPKLTIDKFIDPKYGTISSRIQSADNDIDYNKLAKTKEGLRLFDIQKIFDCKLTKACFNDANMKLPEQFTGSRLYDTDLSDAYKELGQTNMIFYFPVLEKFKGLRKQECIDLLESGYILPQELTDIEFQASKDNLLYPTIKDFQSSEYNCYYDFYSSLEQEFLSHYELPLGFTTITKRNLAYDFVKANVLEGFKNTFDHLGFPYREGAFHNAYQMLSSWQWALDEQNDAGWQKLKDSALQYRSSNSEYQHFALQHKLYKSFMTFVENMLKELLMPNLLSSLTYFNGSFTTVKRLYSFEDDSMLAKIVYEYIESKKDYKILLDTDKFGIRLYSYDIYTPDYFINKWLKAFKIGDSIIIKTDPENLGFYLYIHNNFEMYPDTSLADLGHGVTQTVALLLLIETKIIKGSLEHLRNKTGELQYNNAKTILCIEEPEVSMHPDFQSKLAEVFEDASTNYHTDFIFLLETHSEYLVRKSQAIVSGYNEEPFKHNPFEVYYFKADGDVYPLGYTKSGLFERPFGSGFFDESARSTYEILKRQELAQKGE